MFYGDIIPFSGGVLGNSFNRLVNEGERLGVGGFGVGVRSWSWRVECFGFKVNVLTQSRGGAEYAEGFRGWWVWSWSLELESGG